MIRRWLASAWHAARIALHMWALGILAGWMIGPPGALDLLLWFVSGAGIFAWLVVLLSFTPWRADPGPGPTSHNSTESC